LQQAARIGARACADAHKTFSREIFSFTDQDAFPIEGADQSPRYRTEIHENEIRGAWINPAAEGCKALFQ
jgi:hypothetical protein